MSKITMTHIIIHWHEFSSNYNVIPEETKFNSFAEAHTAIRNIYHNDPQKVTCIGGYDKLKFSIYFADGESYEQGRLDISEREDNPFTSENIIGSHCIEFLTYMAEKENSESAKEMLEKYSFEDVSESDLKPELIFQKRIGDVDYRLEYDDVFSSMKEKQYFLVVDDELEEGIYSLENSEEALDSLILKYMEIELPTTPKQMIDLIAHIYNIGFQDRDKEIQNLIGSLNTVIADYN
jgi:hypothetical protein